MHGFQTGKEMLHPPQLSPHPPPPHLSPKQPISLSPHLSRSPHPPIVLHSFLKEMWHFSLVSVTHSIFFRFSITVLVSMHGTLMHLVRFSMTVSVTVL